MATKSAAKITSVKPKPTLAPVSERVGEQAVPLVGDGTWDWLRAYRVGCDIKVVNCQATRWGGADDGMDSGMTASGVNTAGHPETLGVSLPMRRGNFAPTLGSPIPAVPWKTMVTVFSHKTGKSITVPLIDIGPAKWTKHGIDLTNATVLALGLGLGAGVYDVDYRIHDVCPARSQSNRV